MSSHMFDTFPMVKQIANGRKVSHKLTLDAFKNVRERESGIYKHVGILLQAPLQKSARTWTLKRQSNQCKISP